ncbi:MAG: hypothetical protein WCV86_04220 [Patescibacteria group bacterium]|jgi:hypothetical protein
MHALSNYQHHKLRSASSGEKPFRTSVLFVLAFVTLFAGSLAVYVGRVSSAPGSGTPPILGTTLGNIYNGGIQITGNGASPDTLALGAGGSVIAGTGNLYFLPNESIVDASYGSYFRGVSGQPAQGLVIDTRLWDATGVTLQNNNAAQITLAALATGSSTTAASFLGGLRIEGNLVKENLNAVVDTSAGPATLSTLEAPDARFVDYGTGTTQDGRTEIAIDALYAETVDLETYYVFTSPASSDAVLAVTEQTTDGFTVLASHDTDFTYKIVAVRKGYSQKRFSQ